MTGDGVRNNLGSPLTCSGLLLDGQQQAHVPPLVCLINNCSTRFDFVSLLLEPVGNQSLWLVGSTTMPTTGTSPTLAIVGSSDEGIVEDTVCLRLG